MTFVPPPGTQGFEVARPKAGRTVVPGSRDAGRNVYLYPGDIIASAEPRVISTVLGSCVAVFLCDPVTRTGGANHYLLPHLITGDGNSPRFGIVAMRLLEEKLLALGCERRNLRAKVFGGACQFVDPEGRASIGQQNVRLALRTLDDAGIPVLVNETGGSRGRKALFHTDTGDVWVRQL